MMSRKDRVVRARTDPDTTMPKQRSRKKFIWISVMKENSPRCVLLSLRDELEASGRYLVLKKLTSALILTEALREYGLTELTIGLQHQAQPTVIGGLNVHGLKGYRCDRCPKTKVQNGAKYQALSPDYPQNAN